MNYSDFHTVHAKLPVAFPAQNRENKEFQKQTRYKYKVYTSDIWFQCQKLKLTFLQFL